MKRIAVICLSFVLILMSIMGVNCDSNEDDGNRDEYNNTDTTPPVISGITVSDIALTTATISWTTDEPATGNVDSGLAGSYAFTFQSTSDANPYKTGHNIELYDLAAYTTYTFRVISTDADGNQAVSAEQTFATLASADTTAPVIPDIIAPDSEEIRQAERAAQGRLNRMADITYPDWEGARAIALQPCYDLQGRLNSYMFSVEKDGESIGHIHLGSSLYNYALVEAGTASPPSIPTTAQVEASLRGDLDLEPSQQDISEAVGLLFIGGAKGLYAMYQTGGQLVAVKLSSKSAVFASELQTNLPSPEEYGAQMEDAIASMPAGRDSSGHTAIPMDCLYDIYWDHEEGCGPATGVMIAAYYSQLGYDNFPYCSPAYNDDLNAAYDQIHEEMMGGWWPWGTSPLDYGSGFVDYAEDKGYGNFDSYRLPVNGDHYHYWQVIEYIDDGYPLAGLYPFHYVAVRGYDYNEGNYYDLICNNPDSGYGHGGVQWMGWWAYDWFNMIAIMD